MARQKERAKETVAAANIPIPAWSRLIDEWIFSERDRLVLKRRLLDGIVFEALAEEFSLSVSQVKRIAAKGMDELIKHL